MDIDEILLSSDPLLKAGEGGLAIIGLLYFLKFYGDSKKKGKKYTLMLEVLNEIGRYADNCPDAKIKSEIIQILNKLEKEKI
jgi:hypothetical protein